MTKEEFKEADFRPSEVIDGLNRYFEDKTKSFRIGNKFVTNSNYSKREVADLAIAWLRSLGIFYVPNMVLPRYELTEEACIAEYGCSCIRDMYPTTITYCRNDVVRCEERKRREDLEKEVKELKEELKKAGDEIGHLRIKCRAAKRAGIEETRETLHADICDRFKMHGMKLPMGLEMLEKVEDDVEWLVDEVHNLRRTEERLMVENRVLDDNIAKQKQAMDILDKERGEYQKKLIAANKEAMFYKEKVAVVMEANERLKKKVASFGEGFSIIDKKRKEWYRKYECEHERAVSLDKKHKEDISKIEHLELQVEQLKIARDTNESGYLAMKNKVRQLEAEVDRLNAMIKLQSQ